MTKKNTLLVIYGIVVFLSLIYFLPIAKGYDYIFTDAENDVYQYCQSTDETVNGDFHDEIDVVNFNITGMHVSFTIVGNFGDWNTSHRAALTFSSEFFPWEGPLNYAWRPPYYRIGFENDSSFFVKLEKGYSLGGDQFAYEVWNGTGWENRTTATPANIISEISTHSISAEIPDAVEEIPSSMKCLLYTECWPFGSDCIWADFVPAMPTEEGGEKILGYNVFLVICVMIGISLLLVRRRFKLK